MAQILMEIDDMLLKKRNKKDYRCIWASQKHGTLPRRRR
jgi:hypothetical protein